jgi:hypothetical protein
MGGRRGGKCIALAVKGVNIKFGSNASNAVVDSHKQDFWINRDCRASSKSASRRAPIRCLAQTAAIIAFFLFGQYVNMSPIAELEAILIPGNRPGDVIAKDSGRFKVNHYCDGTESKPFPVFV